MLGAGSGGSDGGGAGAEESAVGAGKGAGTGSEAELVEKRASTKCFWVLKIRDWTSLRTWGGC